MPAPIPLLSLKTYGYIGLTKRGNMTTPIGDLSKEAQEKLAELIEKYDPINNKSIRSNGNHRPAVGKKSRLPIPGTVITKNYKGKLIRVKVLEKGFEYENARYKSLSALAAKITGAHWSGYSFFGI